MIMLFRPPVLWFRGLQYLKTRGFGSKTTHDSTCFHWGPGLCASEGCPQCLYLDATDGETGQASRTSQIDRTGGSE